MLPTIRHQDAGAHVVIAKLLTGYLRFSSKVRDSDGFVDTNKLFDADFVAHIVSWQMRHGLTADGIIGPSTWTAIAKNAPTTSTAKNRIGPIAMAAQLILGGNLTADAIYGQRTKAAVAASQDAYGLTVDGICGPKTWNALIVGSDVAPAEEPSDFRQPTDYKQADSRWGKNVYSNHADRNQTMSNSGCGPTAMADVVAVLKDSSVTPWTLAQLAMQWGDRTDDSGTAWSFFRHIADHYHFSKMVQSATKAALQACLSAGGYVVCSMGPGYWTKGGHFICAWKYDDTYIYANDPASSSRKKQKIADFMAQRKQFFCFYPDAKAQPEPSTETVTARGTKIIDISKWQPSVDYGALARDTALIILRAGVRKDGGAICIDECFQKHAEGLKALGVRFGVYFYSQARNAAQAVAEAYQFWVYAQEYEPLFWAVDLECPDTTTEAIQAFADEMRRVIPGEKFGAYVAHHLYSQYRFDDLRELFDFVWIPRYSSKCPNWPCDLWQHTSTGTVDGISGNVDLNTITGQGHDLTWFCGGDSV